MMKRLKVLLALLMLTTCLTGLSYAKAKRIYYMGILPLRKPTEMLRRFKATEKHIREQTGLDIRLRLFPTTGFTGGYTSCVKALVSGECDFAYLAPVTCVQAQGSGPCLPFACAQKKGSPIYYGHLAVKVDSPYQSLEDLKGKAVCGTSASSTSGNLMPSGWLKDQGIDKFTYFGKFEYAGRHDKAAEAVIIGAYDGCFINEATFNKYNEGKVQLRSLWKHPAVPEFPFCYNTERVDKKTLKKVTEALLNMHEYDLEGVKASNKNYDKWVAIEWKDYAAVKKVVDSVHGEKFYDLDYWQEMADKKASAAETEKKK
jgi:phosphonate transport system substrate-binding protein